MIPGVISKAKSVAQVARSAVEGARTTVKDILRKKELESVTRSSSSTLIEAADFSSDIPKPASNYNLLGAVTDRVARAKTSVQKIT